MLLRSLAAAALLSLSNAAQPADWPGFRGPSRDGVAPATAAPPLEWSDSVNLVWRTELPGRGSSSPVVLGDRVFVACYSGYGLDPEEPGDPKALEERVLCLSIATGEVVWEVEIPAPRAAAARQVQIAEHGFASPTPATDGERLYCYFGGVGLLALAVEDGEAIWRAELGRLPERTPEEIAARPKLPDGNAMPVLRWGAAASPLVFGDLVIVNASEESDSVRAFDRATGEPVWKWESAALEGSAVSPMIAGTGDAAVLVVVAGGAAFGLDPRSGAELWSVPTGQSGGLSPTPVADAERVYVFGGMGDGYAIRFARDLDEDTERVVWRSENQDIPSPVLHDGRLYLVRTNATVVVLEAASGEMLHNGRLEGRIRGGVYASPVLAGGRLYVQSRESGCHVYSVDVEPKLLAKNRFEADASQFNASPAITGDRLLVRSHRFLYCVRAEE